MAAKTITFNTDRGVVTYSARLKPGVQHTDIADGLLGGDPSLIAIVRQVLTGNLPKTVRIAEPNLHYRFSPARNTLADVAAAMLVAGDGRGRLSDSGWEALDAAMDGDTGVG